jgi:hypothetical protein
MDEYKREKRISRSHYDVDSEQHEKVKKHCMENFITVREWIYDAINEKLERDNLENL